MEVFTPSLHCDMIGHKVNEGRPSTYTLAQNCPALANIGYTSNGMTYATPASLVQ